MSIFKKLTAKPWLTPGLVDDFPGGDALPMPNAKLGLWAFLAVLTTLFSLFIVAYVMRMDYGDWQELADPGLLWLNTLMLILSSVAMQWARMSADRGEAKNLRLSMLAGGFFSFAFLAGQLMAWREISAAGYFAIANNPANAFFYLITGLHAVHVLGGLWVWARTAYKLRGEFEPRDVSLSIELCTVYWHYLLLVWVTLFALLLST
jgi:cytochrome c oxidase subunit 3